jgi:hypothetical protein
MGVDVLRRNIVQGSTFVLRMNNCANNPPQRKAPKRYG